MKMKTQIPAVETKDLWQSAFMLACGCELKDLRLCNDGARQEVFFRFTGDNAQELSFIFKSGQASCHVGLLKASMNHLKDELFKVISR